MLVENPKTAYYAAAVAVPVFAGIASRMVACSEEMQKNLSIRSPEQCIIDSVSTVTVPLITTLIPPEPLVDISWNARIIPKTVPNNPT